MNRHLCRGRRCDNGDWVMGFYCKHLVCRQGKTTLIDVIQVVVSPSELAHYEVDPATVEPVKIKVMATEGYEACPNCRRGNISFMRTNDNYGQAPEPFQCDFCPDCGQALDWSEDELRKAGRNN